jgi:uncharacterized protein
MDDDLRQGDQTPPRSLIPYDRWMHDAMRQVVARTVAHVAKEGLPDGHHLYITFRTGYPGVQLPARLREQYPDEMTIVLQHQFWDLALEPASQTISVKLSFGGVSSLVVIPVVAVTAFADPYVQFGLRLQPPPLPEPAPAALAAPAPAAEAPDPSPAEEPGAGAPASPQVVSLDAFRRRRD